MVSWNTVFRYLVKLFHWLKQTDTFEYGADDRLTSCCACVQVLPCLTLTFLHLVVALEAVYLEVPGEYFVFSLNTDDDIVTRVDMIKDLFMVRDGKMSLPRDVFSAADVCMLIDFLSS